MDYSKRGKLNPLLRWLWELLSLFSSKQITIPSDHRERVIAVKTVLENDCSGMVNSILDFAINAALVNYSIDAENTNLSEKLNDWLGSINSDLRGQVPTGLKSLANQYFRERWKGSSLLVLRSIWEKKDDLILPTKMWFIDGENIKVEDDNTNRMIGQEKYSLYIKGNKYKPLPSFKNELIFVQKPFASWSDISPIPFLVQRGVYQNLKLLELVMNKGENFLAKALEYMLVMKKGTEGLAKEGKSEFIYDKKDLTEAKEDLQTLMKDMKTVAGVPTYVTNFDTNFEHLVPNYEAILKETLYNPIERRLLASLGLIDIVQGVSSTRQQAMLNPKPFITEVEKGIGDFQTLLYDIVYTIIEKNKLEHPKYFSYDLKINTSQIKAFIDDSLRNHLRSMYDRGVLSKETYADVVGSVPLDIEVTRRTQETKDKLDEVMYPPVIQNTEAKSADLSPFEKQDNLPEDKKSIEKKNFKGEEEISLIIPKNEGTENSSILNDMLVLEKLELTKKQKKLIAKLLKEDKDESE